MPIKKQIIYFSFLIIALLVALKIVWIIDEKNKVEEPKMGVADVINDYSSKTWLEDNCIVVDDNTGEQFIIKSNKTSYQGLNNTDVYFSVENTGDTDDVEISFPFTAGSGRLNILKEISFDSKTVIAPIMEATGETYECNSGMGTTTCDMMTQTGTSTTETIKDLFTAVDGSIEIGANETKYFLANIIFDTDSANFNIKALGTTGEGLLSRD